MSVPYAKPHLTFDAQLEKIASRGLVISDEARALEALRNIGYYRLSAYLHTFRVKTVDGAPGHDERENKYVEGASFTDVLLLWEYDRELRMLLIDGLEQFEIALRTAIAYRAGHVDPFIHHRPDLLADEFTAQPDTTQADQLSAYDAWLIKYLERVEGSQGEAFVQWFTYKYEGMLPIWAAIEVMEFGNLSRLLRGLPLAIRRQVAEDFGLDTQKAFQSWVATFNGLRNHAAHHARLWNRTLVTTAKRPNRDAVPDLSHLHMLDQIPAKKIYAPLAILAWLLASRMEHGQRWGTRVRDLALTFPESHVLSIAQSGFPTGWAQEPLWQR